VVKNVEIIGMNELHELINGLPREFQYKFLKESTREAGKFIEKAAIDNVPSQTVKKQIKRFPVKSQIPGTWVGWNTKERKKDYDAAKTRAQKAWAWMGGFWLEYGTSGRWSKKDRRARKIEPIGWFRRAVDMNIDKTEKEFDNIILKRLNRKLDKLGFR